MQALCELQRARQGCLFEVSLLETVTAGVQKKPQSRHPLGKEGQYLLCTRNRHCAKCFPWATGTVPIFQTSKQLSQLVRCISPGPAILLFGALAWPSSRGGGVMFILDF